MSCYFSATGEYVCEVRSTTMQCNCPRNQSGCTCGCAATVTSTMKPTQNRETKEHFYTGIPASRKRPVATVKPTVKPTDKPTVKPIALSRHMKQLARLSTPKPILVAQNYASIVEPKPTALQKAVSYLK